MGAASGGRRGRDRMSDVLALLEDPAEGVSLDDATLANLLAQGVDATAIGSPWCVCRAHVMFQPWADRYEPMVTGEPALIFGILAHGLIDLAAIVDGDLLAGLRKGFKVADQRLLGALDDILVVLRPGVAPGQRREMGEVPSSSRWKSTTNEYVRVC